MPRLGGRSHGNESGGRVGSRAGILAQPPLLIFSGGFAPNSDRFIKAFGLTLLMKVEIRILVIRFRIRFRIQAGIRNKGEQEKALSPSLCGNGRVDEDVFLIQGFDFSRGHSHLIFASLPLNLFICPSGL